jgi:hypothetical protein
VLRTLDAQALIDSALARISGHPDVYSPDSMLFQAVEAIRSRLRTGIQRDRGYTGLWKITTDFLLARSSTPPPEPKDWAQPFKQGCTCADCRALRAFAVDPDARQCRFPLNKGRRQHLHRRIDGDGMDMTHETERRGRPYTLVCTKTRASHEQRLRQYAEDIRKMEFLVRHTPDNGQQLAEQLATAISHAPPGRCT